MQPQQQLSVELDTSLQAVYTCCHVDAPAVSINLCMKQFLPAIIVWKPELMMAAHMQ